MTLGTEKAAEHLMPHFAKFIKEEVREKLRLSGSLAGIELKRGLEE
jgi:hypothetical protein